MKTKLMISFLLCMVLFNCTRKTPVILAVEGTKGNVERGPKTILYDNFSTRKSEWQQFRGNWIISGKGYFVQKSADPRHINALLYVNHPQVANITIETLVRVDPDIPKVLTNSPEDQEIRQNIRKFIGAGIIFRMKDEKNFYMFRLAGEDGAVLGKLEDEKWFNIANPRTINVLPERIRFSEKHWYRLKVEAYGDRITCYINDSVVVNKLDSTFSMGKFGLCTYKTGAEFDYFKAYDKTESETR